jgi:uncharacterized protein (TIGR02231 family)
MTTLDSKIIEVVVFPDRACVTRRGTIALDAGLHQIEFVDLPRTVDADSLRVTGQGSAVAVLLGVEARRVFYSETPAIDVRELEQRLEQLQLQDSALLDQQAAAEVRLNFAKGLAEKATDQLARGLAFGRADIVQSGTLIDFVQQQIDRAQAVVREVQQQRRDLAKQIEKANQELNQRRTAQPRERLAAAVEVEIKQAGELTLELTYLVSGAGWNALYDLRLAETAEPKMQLTYLGQVTQRSGEEWLDVALTLSTARPALTTLQPELKPWYLSVYTPLPPVAAPQVRAAGAAMRKMEAAAAPPEFEAQAFGVAPAPVTMETLSAQVNSEGASVTFKLVQSVSVPSDGSPHKVTVTTFDLSPKIDYLSVPKLAEAVYRRAKIINRSDYLLLDGPAGLFIEGGFVGTLPVKRAAPNEEFELSLGVDDRVTVKRELKAREVDKKLIGDRRRLRVAYEIEIKNLRTQKIDLEVRDQFPVSRHEQVKVKLEACDPKPIEQTDLNELKWRLALDPNAKAVARFEFSIEQPTNLQVQGLP